MRQMFAQVLSSSARLEDSLMWCRQGSIELRCFIGFHRVSLGISGTEVFPELCPSYTRQSCHCLKTASILTILEASNTIA